MLIVIIVLINLLSIIIIDLVICINTFIYIMVIDVMIITMIIILLLNLIILHVLNILNFFQIPTYITYKIQITPILIIFQQIKYPFQISPTFLINKTFCLFLLQLYYFNVLLLFQITNNIQSLLLLNVFYCYQKCITIYFTNTLYLSRTRKSR